MPPEDDTAQGTKPKGSQGSDTTPDKASASDQHDAKSVSGEGAQGDPNQQVVTPAILKGVLDTQLRTFKGELSKATSPFKEEIDAITKRLEGLQKSDSGDSSPGAQKKGQQAASDSPELVELRKKVADLESANQAARDAAEAAQKRERDYRFKTRVTDALVRAKCRRPEEVFLMIAPKLQFDEENDRIFGTQKSQFGVRDLDVDEYIKSVVSEDVVPELFEGKTRPGSAAGGDGGSADGKWLFTMDQLRDGEYYKKHRDEILQAVAAGRVKPDEK